MRNTLALARHLTSVLPEQHRQLTLASCDPSNPARRARALRLLQRAAACDTRAASALAIGDKIRKAQKGDPREALALAQKIGAPVVAGRGLDRFKKAVLWPVKVTNKITHTGPIEKAHQAVQGAVGKYMPIAKPFINIHNKLAAKTQGVLKKAGAGSRGTTQSKGKLSANDLLSAAATMTKGNATAQRAVQKAAPKLKAAAHELQGALKGLARAKRQELGTGTYRVTLPNGKMVAIAASKVVA